MQEISGNRNTGFLRPLKNPEMDRDEEGHTFLTHKYVVELCEFNGQYTTPKCNNKLFLHYKGKCNPENSDSRITAHFEHHRRFRENRELGRIYEVQSNLA